ncbi:MAG: hypothetical protein MUC92_09520 [Fimbriimonadaceae bacterium]|jgi:hypothetical protein|nr:hypothetical protein [Fimbriimonadaceae bacterium]
MKKDSHEFLTPHLTPDELHGWVTDTLDADAKYDVSLHLEVCNLCQEDVNDLRLEMAKPGLPAPAPSLTLEKGAPWHRWVPWGLAAACLAALSFVLVNPGIGSQPQLAQLQKEGQQKDAELQELRRQLDSLGWSPQDPNGNFGLNPDGKPDQGSSPDPSRLSLSRSALKSLTITPTMDLQPGSVPVSPGQAEAWQISPTRSVVSGAFRITWPNASPSIGRAEVQFFDPGSPDTPLLTLPLDRDGDRFFLQSAPALPPGKWYTYRVTLDGVPLGGDGQKRGTILLAPPESAEETEQLLRESRSVAERVIALLSGGRFSEAKDVVRESQLPDDEKQALEGLIDRSQRVLR